MKLSRITLPLATVIMVFHIAGTAPQAAIPAGAHRRAALPSLAQLLMASPVSAMPQQAPPQGGEAAQKEKDTREVPQRVRVSGKAMQARLVRMVDPKYPKEAKKYRHTGTVLLGIVVDRDGQVIEINLLRGDPVFVKAAMEAVQKWRYRPLTIRGQAVEVVTEAECNFALKKP